MIQPKLNELKKKYGDDKQRFAQETINIYKEHKVNPFGSCLPLLLQIPILIGLFNVIQSGLDPNNSYLLYDGLKNFDISQVQTVFLGILDLTKVNFWVLPVIVGVLQYLQMKLSFARKQPQPTDKSEMEVANKTMTYIMPVMIAFFTASVPSGVGLYWAFSTIYGIVQQMVINKQAEQEHTQIKVIDPNQDLDKKELYKQLNEQRKAEKMKKSATTNGTEIIEASSDEDDKITTIKA